MAKSHASKPPPPKTAPKTASAPKTDWRRIHGPFDIIGDVHGCADELVELLGILGYGVRFEGAGEDRRALTTAP